MQLKKTRRITIIECLLCHSNIRHPEWGTHLKYQHQTNGLEYKKKFHTEKTQEDLLIEGAVTCAICGLIAHDLVSHITRTHKMSIVVYREQFRSPIHSSRYTAALSEKIKGDKNPAYQSDGRLSPFSKKFLHYTNEEDRLAMVDKAKTSIRNNHSNTTTIEYWMKRTGGNVEDAEMRLSERQCTFSLEKCIAKFGKEDGTTRWLERQMKWHTNYKKSNFSKVSQRLFWDIFYQYDNIDVVYFAQLGNQDNNELTLKLSHRTIKPDFIDIERKRIIEFDGDYWHGKHYSSERLASRDEAIVNENYKILHIAECDYKKDPEKVISTCLSFLTM